MTDETLLNQLVENPAKYLPPIVGVFGGFIPLLIFSIVSDLFQGFRLIAIAMLALSVWLGYLLGALVCALFAFNEWLTVLLLLFTVLSLLLVLSLRKFAANWKHTPKVSGASLIGALFLLTIASTNQYALTATTIVHVDETAGKGQPPITAVELVTKSETLRVTGPHVGNDFIFAIPAKMFEDVQTIALIRGKDRGNPGQKTELSLDSTAFAFGNVYRWQTPTGPESSPRQSPSPSAPENDSNKAQ